MKNWILRIRASDKQIFDDIKSGLKTVETRAATEKYRKIAPGDTLIFTCEKERMRKTVKEVTRFATRDKMCKEIPFKQISPRAATEKEAKEKYDTFPGYQEKIKKFGLVALYL
ncbi:MAG: hypothetical protein G01um101433_98 [Parcubacteria group bacterium Gr01-1014_33]|nr:MAG: hypothetical protein G01um101433_98 [Parcubacteria group bacterium Gr01-1014_33]